MFLRLSLVQHGLLAQPPVEVVKDRWSIAAAHMGVWVVGSSHVAALGRMLVASRDELAVRAAEDSRKSAFGSAAHG